VAQCVGRDEWVSLSRRDIRAIVSADRLTAIGMGVFTSTGYTKTVPPYDRPAVPTVALSRKAIATIGSPITPTCRCRAMCDPVLWKR